MPQSNGGISSNSRVSIYPMIDTRTGASGLYAFDAPNGGYNDLNNPSNYFYRMEEIIPGKTPTVNGLVVVYRDLGPVRVTFNISASNDLGNVITATTGIVSLGNTVPTGRIITRNNIGIAITGQNLQLSWTRAAGAGPLSIVKILMYGQVELS
jgi:hypothetical protein